MSRNVVQFMEAFQEFQWESPQEIRYLISELVSQRRFIDHDRNLNHLEYEIQKNLITVMIKELEQYLAKIDEI